MGRRLLERSTIPFEWYIALQTFAHRAPVLLMTINRGKMRSRVRATINIDFSGTGIFSTSKFVKAQSVHETVDSALRVTPGPASRCTQRKVISKSKLLRIGYVRRENTKTPTIMLCEIPVIVLTMSCPVALLQCEYNLHRYPNSAQPKALTLKYPRDPGVN